MLQICGALLDICSQNWKIINGYHTSGVKTGPAGGGGRHPWGAAF